MISLEGLTLATGRAIEARWILRTFAHYVSEGLIPNMFPEGQNRVPLPHRRCDVVVLSRAPPLRRALPRLAVLGAPSADFKGHRAASSRRHAFGIKVDPNDGLLTQGAEGFALAWMDAKVGDWVVTPRRGKAVVINALWYNALRLLADWLREVHDPEAEKLTSSQLMRTRRAILSTVVFGTPRAAICTMSLMARMGTTTPSDRTRSSRLRSITGSSTGNIGRGLLPRCTLSWSLRSGFALWRQASPSTSRATSAICALAMQPITRALCGLG